MPRQSVPRTRSPSPPPLPRCHMSRATKLRWPNCLNNISTWAHVFDKLRQATLRVPELHDITSDIINKSTTRAWSLDHGLLFFDGRLYIPATSPLLPDLLEALLIDGRTKNTNLLVMGFHTPLLIAAATYNFPSSILLTQPWPTGIIPSATVTFFDDMSSQFMTVRDVHINVNSNSRR